MQDDVEPKESFNAGMNRLFVATLIVVFVMLGCAGILKFLQAPAKVEVPEFTALYAQSIDPGLKLSKVAVRISMWNTRVELGSDSECGDKTLSSERFFIAKDPEKGIGDSIHIAVDFSTETPRVVIDKDVLESGLSIHVVEGLFRNSLGLLTDYCKNKAVQKGVWEKSVKLAD